MRNNIPQNLFLASFFFILLLTLARSLRPYQSIILEKEDTKIVKVILHIPGYCASYDSPSMKSYSKMDYVKEGELGMELYPTGSNLPDCTHACGACFPCRRVMISFKCSVESCPVVYRCMCKGKYYHVPSN